MTPRRRPPRKAKKVRLRVLPSIQTRENPALAARPVNPTIKHDWSVIAHEGVRLFEFYRFGTPEVRERTIHTILRRWKSLFSLRVDMYTGNFRLNELYQQISQLEAQNDMILRRIVNNPTNHVTRIQRRTNLIQRRAAYDEQIIIIKKLKTQIRQFRQRMEPLPMSIKKDLNALAPEFWKRMTDFLLEEVVD
jgi:hypothetical protein